MKKPGAQKTAHKKIPGEMECRRLLKKYGAQPALLAHSRQVSRAAYALALKLKRKGVAISPQLVRAAALLHDIAKLEKNARGEWKPRHDHARAGAEVLRKEGLTQLAQIAQTHVAEPGELLPRTWEQKVVFYADKRVEWDKIVSAGERFEALKRRYAKYPGAVGKITAVQPFLLKVEKQIFSKIGRRPEELLAIIREEGV